MIPVLCIVLAGFFNAIMDILENNYRGSVFSRFNHEWWDPEVSWVRKWKVKNPILRFLYTPFSDAWHLSKMLMVLCWGLAISPDLYGVVYFLIFSAIFELFYGTLLRDKKNV